MTVPATRRYTFGPVIRPTHQPRARACNLPFFHLLVVWTLIGGGCQRQEPPHGPAPTRAPQKARSPQETAVEPSRQQPSPSVAYLSPVDRDRRGDEHLKAGRFEQAIADYDFFLEFQPQAEPWHWRRGIACYYAGQFDKGVRQFELHRTVNTSDVENAAWHFLCKAQLDGPEAAREALLPVGPDGRVPMMRIYEMFAGRATAQQVLEQAATAPPAELESALFYAHLYIGLYHEALGQTEQARHHIHLAATTHTSRHYMGDIARMHAGLSIAGKLRHGDSAVGDEPEAVAGE